MLKSAKLALPVDILRSIRGLCKMLSGLSTYETEAEAAGSRCRELGDTPLAFARQGRREAACARRRSSSAFSGSNDFLRPR